MSLKRGIQAKDLYELKSVSDPNLSPDGNLVAFVQTTISETKNAYVSNLFVYNRQTKRLSQWTFGEDRNISPRWSPDGTRLAFVSNRSGKNQIYIMDISGGEAEKITDVENGASNPVWSPDGSKIAFTVPLKPGEGLKTKEKQEDEEEKPVPFEVDRLKYKSDHGGFFNGKYDQIAVIDVETRKMELLTEGETNHSLGGFLPDGSKIVFGADYSSDKDFSFIEDLYLLDMKSKEKEKITSGRGMFFNPSFSPDGRYIIFYGHEREFQNATLVKIWLYDIKEKTVTCLSENWDLSVGDYAIGDFQQGVTMPAPLWSEMSEGMYFTASKKGSTNIFYTDLSGNVKQVTNLDGHVYGLSKTENHFAIATISWPDHPGDVYEVDLQTGTIQPLTEMNNDFLKTVQLVKPEPIQFQGAEGWTIHGWIMKPLQYKEGEKYPLILEVHGGPHAMYANTYFHEFQMLAASGYAVLYTNPRGSHGYGQKFVNAVRGDYGGNDYKDVMAAVDYALDTFDFIDETRLGVTGGSYGGFMTNWIVSHTNRFKAAVTQRSISNWVSFYGVSDIGYYFNEWQHLVEKNDVDALWNISPLAYVDKVETPLLILHSEKDYRCPIEQAEQLFIALKHRKKKVKFIRFPESNHELSRSGKPNLRVARLEYIKGWFDEFLHER
ncbi:alpha/beta hydrolase family protein [Fervidibacillus halotolerans]|uniref:S9 family peptidase n=1 Tax=Fervidibacillus halotolerans TaxID=2980027 RepID=A0A9E8M0D1_9BACI|nr:S9 family peptidase [Fervidibacillus halotolerans]WAA13032.1 S9 family peptidase [Fervidibacillus halotolerans]